MHKWVERMMNIKLKYQFFSVIKLLNSITLLLTIISCGDALQKNAALRGKFLSSELVNITDVLTPGGPLEGGNTVRITGTNFSNGVKVFLDDVPCTNVQIVSATELSCTAGPHEEETVDTTLVGNMGEAVRLKNSYIYQPAPTLATVTPNTGSNQGGTRITITGTFFRDDMTIKVGSGTCTRVSVNSDTEAVCFTPYHAIGNVSLTVTNTDLQTASLPGSYTYQAQPSYGQVTSFAGYHSNNNNEAITAGNFHTAKSLLEIFFTVWSE